MAASIDQQFIEYIVKSLVNSPDAVKIERKIDEKGVLLELTVDPEDLGRVIGKRGATAQSLRTLLRALGTKNDARYNLKIVDNGAPRPPREDRPEKKDQEDADVVSDHPADNPVADDAAAADDVSSDDISTDESASTDDDVNPSTEDTRSDAISKTRAELAELDDLDV